MKQWEIVNIAIPKTIKSISCLLIAVKAGQIESTEQDKTQILNPVSNMTWFLLNERQLLYYFFVFDLLEN